MSKQFGVYIDPTTKELHVYDAHMREVFCKRASLETDTLASCPVLRLEMLPNRFDILTEKPDADVQLPAGPEVSGVAEA